MSGNTVASAAEFRRRDSSLLIFKENQPDHWDRRQKSGFRLTQLTTPCEVLNIGISKRAMQEYFYNYDALAFAIKNPSSGGTKKLYLKPINNPEEFPFAGKISRRKSGGGTVQVGKIVEEYNLSPDEAERYPITWDEELDVGVVDLKEKPMNK